MIRQIAKVILVVFLTIGTITVAFFTLIFVGIVSFLSAIFGAGQKGNAYREESNTKDADVNSADNPEVDSSEKNDGKARRIERYDGDDVIDV